MGEAKRRKATEPNFGRVHKSASSRGLIVSPPLELNGTTLTIKSTSLDPQELRFALLFWERLVWPTSRMLHIASGPDEQFLEEAGVLTRPEYSIQGDIARGVAEGYLRAFQEREAAEPGVWAVSQGENSFLNREALLSADAGCSLELYRAIPIPKHDVPLAEILEFRHRRRDELLLMRAQLDSFIESIVGASDSESALTMQLKELDTACSDLIKLGREWRFPVYISNFKASFSLSPGRVVSAAGGVWALAQPYGLAAATTAAAVAGLASALELKGDFGLRSAKRPLSPYRYAFHLNEELS